jgi:GR25 family glycosyltransferase involved in LPS biosynthesis
MKIFWINIDKNVERSSFMKKQFEDLNLNDNIRVDAITPDNMNNLLHKNNFPLKCGFIDCKNCDIETACILSHLKAIESGYDSNDEWFMVMEDDTIIPFDINFDNLLKFIPDEIEIVQLFVSMPGQTAMLKETYKKNVSFVPWGCFKCIFPCAAAYLVRNKGAKKLIDNFKNTDGTWDFSKSKSCKLADVLIFQTCKTLTSTYPLYYSNIKLGSTIHNDHLDLHQQGIDSILKFHKEFDPLSHPFIKKIFNK